MYSTEELNALSKKRLQEICKERQWKNYSQLNKPELVNWILTQQQQSPEDTASLPRRELQQMCRDKGMTGCSSLSKEELVAQLRGDETYLKVHIDALFDALQAYPREQQLVLLAPHFTLMGEGLVEETKEGEFPTDEEIRQRLEEIRVPVDEVEEEEGQIPYENRVKTVSASTVPVVQILDENDIANVLNRIETENEDVFRKIPLMRKNVRKCLGLA